LFFILFIEFGLMEIGYNLRKWAIKTAFLPNLNRLFGSKNSKNQVKLNRIMYFVKNKSNLQEIVGNYHKLKIAT